MVDEIPPFNQALMLKALAEHQELLGQRNYYSACEYEFRILIETMKNSHHGWQSYTIMELGQRTLMIKQRRCEFNMLVMQLNKHIYLDDSDPDLLYKAYYEAHKSHILLKNIVEKKFSPGILDRNDPMIRHELHNLMVQIRDMLNITQEFDFLDAKRISISLSKTISRINRIVSCYTPFDAVI